MELRELKELIEGTVDAAFAIDGSGSVVAWNDAAAAKFGLSASEVLGKPYRTIFPDVSMVTVNPDRPLTVCIFPADGTQRQMFLPALGHEVQKQPENPFSSTIPTPREGYKVELTDRETEILRRLAQCETTGTIAEQLQISRTTLYNHVQHAMYKLNAHTRQDAISRAKRAGLI